MTWGHNMETYGKLIVRMYVCTAKPDGYARPAGGWRTLMTKWTEREGVEQQLQTFSEANPELQVLSHQLRVTFDTSEDIRI